MKITIITTEVNSQVYVLSHTDEGPVPTVQSDLDDREQLTGVMVYDHGDNLRPIHYKPPRASTAPPGLWGDTSDTTRKIYES